MGNEIICCEHCGGAIVQYYNDKYSGMRGRCKKCAVDFALE